MRMTPTLMVILAAMAMAGCELIPGERSSEVLDRARILAIQAEPASAAPGDTVQLSALAATPHRDDPALQLVWYLCQHESLDDCALADDLQQIGTGPTISVTIPPEIFPGSDMVYWVDLIYGNYTERALKAVPVRLPGVPTNENPKIREVEIGGAVPIDGTTVTLETGDMVSVRVKPEGIPAEIYDDSGTRTAEEIFMRTFTSGGSLVDLSGTGASGVFEYRAAESQGTYGIWIIMEDGRGGVDWSEHWAVTQQPEN